MEENNNMVGKLREYILKCPYLDKDGKIGVDYLGPNATEYVIETTPVSQIVEKYITGKAKKQNVFVFASREYFGPDTIQNMLNSTFYEKFASWIEKNNDEGILPDIKGIESIEVLSTPYAYSTDEHTARYQIQLKIEYIE